MARERGVLLAFLFVPLDSSELTEHGTNGCLQRVCVGLGCGGLSCGDGCRDFWWGGEAKGCMDGCVGGDG